MDSLAGHMSIRFVPKRNNKVVQPNPFYKLTHLILFNLPEQNALREGGNLKMNLNQD